MRMLVLALVLAGCGGGDEAAPVADADARPENDFGTLSDSDPALAPCSDTTCWCWRRYPIPQGHYFIDATRDDCARLSVPSPRARGRGWDVECVPLCQDCARTINGTEFAECACSSYHPDAGIFDGPGLWDCP